MGIIGKTQGVSSAANPAKNENAMNIQSDRSAGLSSIKFLSMMGPSFRSNISGVSAANKSRAGCANSLLLSSSSFGFSFDDSIFSVPLTFIPDIVKSSSNGIHLPSISEHI